MRTLIKAFAVCSLLVASLAFAENNQTTTWNSERLLVQNRAALIRGTKPVNADNTGIVPSSQRSTSTRPVPLASHVLPSQPEDIALRGLALGSLSSRWPNGIIHYGFETGEFALPASGVALVQLAINYIEARIPVKFVQISSTNDADDYVIFKSKPDSTSSRADTGYKGGEQEVEIGDGAMGYSTILHEITHTLGMKHEQERSDRDNFIIIQTNNITDTAPFGYEGGTVLLTPYDYNSIMHYGPNAFADPPPSMIATQPRCPSISPTYTSLGLNPNGGYTLHDINALWQMYGRRISKLAAGDLHGQAIAVADFDGDGYDDIAIGASGKSVEGDSAVLTRAGVVLVFKGTATHPVPWRLLGPYLNAPKAGDAFGSTLATGDFDGDGYADLAVGSPNSAPFQGANTGAVYLYHGGQFADAFYSGGPSSPCGGLPTTLWAPLKPWRLIRPMINNMIADVGANDEFGFAIISARLETGLADSLIVGSPGWTDTGVVYVYGSDSITTGSTPLPDNIIYPEYLSKKHQGRFGSAIASADFDRDGNADLAISNTSLVGSEQPAVYVYKGNATLDPNLWQTLKGGPSDNKFGTALAFGNLVRNNALGFGDLLELAVAAPDLPGPKSDTGAVIIYKLETTDFGSVQIASSYKIAQAIYSGEDHVEAFGHSLLIANIYSPSGFKRRDVFDELFIGAPEYRNSRGRVAAYVLAPNSQTLLSFWQNLPRPKLARQFGQALSSGRLVAIQPGLPAPTGVFETEIGRVFVGAPLSGVLKPDNNALEEFVEQRVGAVYSFGMGQNTPSLVLELHQASESPWAASD